jgi:hypothetical protein
MPESQPVDEHGGDMTAFFGKRRLLLYDRGKDQRFTLVPDGKIGGARVPLRVEVFFLRLAHAFDDIGARRSTDEKVGFRKKRAFGRKFAHIAREFRIVLHQIVDHLAGQAFGRRDFVFDRFSRCEDCHDVGHARARKDRVLAGFQRSALAAQPHADLEQDRVIDGIGLCKFLRDGGETFPRLHQHNRFGGAVGRCRTGRIEMHAFQLERTPDKSGQKRDDNDEAKHSATLGRFTTVNWNAGPWQNCGAINARQ